MPTCPAGHDSASSDFCDVCGMKIGGAPAAAPDAAASAGPPSAPGPADAAATGGPPGGGEPCPQCGTAKSGRFCETCGYDFDTGTAAPVSQPTGAAGAGTAPAGDPAASGAPASGVPATAVTPAAAGTTAGGTAGTAAGPAWTAVAASDRAYYDAVVAAGGPDAATIEFPAYCPERRFALTGKEMRIGRHSASRGLYPEIDLTGPPTDPGISRLHAVLVAEPDGGWSLLDPGSENGTQVNGNDVAAGGKVALHDGDTIHLGAWTVITIHAG